jgi:hypothetical protein
MPMLRCAVALRSRFQKGMFVARHGRGTAALCKSNGKDAIETLLARHGHDMGTAWERYGMCELAFKELTTLLYFRCV